jgi:hypothetical protein
MNAAIRSTTIRSSAIRSVTARSSGYSSNLPMKRLGHIKADVIFYLLCSKEQVRRRLCSS